MTVKDIVNELLRVIDDAGVYLGPNGKELALLDAEEADKNIDALEEMVEELQYNADDYWTIDKDDLSVIFASAMREVFFAGDGEYLPTDESDYPSWLEDAEHELKLQLEKRIGNG